ncbi:hypothetical protein NPIL_680551 [Nephila pilipes]|uniref:Uncharacterized protein n=1 Tax=Nephila pilipes TaxID=299642 RepID=A0A8X6TKQ7_NEPPI|nr:hypothetical protein NPIL_680551 [Nephila pilipes]
MGHFSCVVPGARSTKRVRKNDLAPIAAINPSLLLGRKGTAGRLQLRGSCWGWEGRNQERDNSVEEPFIGRKMTTTLRSPNRHSRLQVLINDMTRSNKHVYFELPKH